MDEKIFTKVEEKTNVKKEDIISLAKLAGKNITKEKKKKLLRQ